MKHNNFPEHRKIGFLYLTIAITILLLDYDYLTNKSEFGLMGTFLTFGLSVTYFMQLLFLYLRNKKKENREDLSFDFLVLLSIFEVSAFNINKELPLFQSTPFWVSAMLILANISMGYLLFPSKSQKNSVIYRLALIIATAAIPLFMYYTIYLLPYSIMSLIGILFFGLSTHVFAPLLMTIFFIQKLIKKVFIPQPNLRKYSFIGFCLPILISIIFLTYWNFQNEKINTILNHQTITKNHELPVWVEIAQKLPKNVITEKVLKSKLVYSTAQYRSFFENPMTQFHGETIKHDPLVFLASLIFDSPNLSTDESLKIIKYHSGKKIELNEHLWGDENLKTTAVVTQVMLMPQYRIAYTEKTLSIQNTQKSNTGEAIYTFELPPNSTVSSLSLWINGIEQKAAITTKLKAETAYKQIVGVENRDPVTVSWKEGNKVVVRVFPCTIESPRKFKIGITSPLQHQQNSNKLSYQNISFDGPDVSNAIESIKIQSETKLNHLENNQIECILNQIIDQDYTPDWSISFDAPPLSKNAFVFEGQNYGVVPLEAKNETKNIKKLYLDINSEWNEKEIEQSLKTKFKTYVYFNKRMIEKSEPEFNQALEQLKNLNFSIFPYFKIPKNNNSLVISKNPKNTPNIEDLRLLNFNFNDTTSAPSEFHTNLKSFLSQDFKPNVFALNNQTGSFLQSLIDLHAVNYHTGTTSDLSNLLEKMSFVTNTDNDTIIPIPMANVSLVKSKKLTSNANGSNHLMRLFTYNHILQTVGKKFITSPESVTEDQIKEVLITNVVTPVSNLIVLESTEDYKRFNIKQNQNNSLENANIKSAGSVPEPHEWVLIILGLSFVLFFTLKQWKSGF